VAQAVCLTDFANDGILDLLAHSLKKPYTQQLQFFVFFVFFFFFERCGNLVNWGYFKDLGMNSV
jgi:hypothetical protein